jgi:putative FmdB family regulatory protein
MPIYDLLCTKCGHQEERRYETEQAYRNEERACGTCKKGTLERMLSTFSIGRRTTESGHTVDVHPAIEMVFHTCTPEPCLEIRPALIKRVRKDARCN